MKKILHYFLIIAVSVISTSSFAQRVKVSGALGGSAYYGDLVQGAPILKQVSPALTLGGSYDIMEKMRLRLNLSFLGISGDDKDNKQKQFQERNLNFKSFIWEVSAAAEYDFLNTAEEYSFTPYIFAGPGLFHFNPYTVDRFGEKQYLQKWGTEGQGLASYPDRKPYALTQLNIGFGGGVRYDLNDDLAIGAEVFIRKTFTDYLDDVSTTYVDPAVFAAEGNAYSSFLSFRGDEAPYSNQHPGPVLPRGNPKSKDLFYSFQLKLTYKLSNLDWGGPLGFYGGGGGGSRGGGGGGRVRNPRSVL